MGGVADFDFLANHAESLPSGPAVILGGQTLGVATLKRRANRAGNVFKSLGCEAGDRVALMSFSSVAGFEIANGVRGSGTVVVPVNYRLRGPEIAYLLNDSGARVVVAGPDHVDAVAAAQPEVKGGDRRFIAIGDRTPEGWLSYRALMDGAADAPPLDAVGDGLLASMIYTSGTTGHPKGAWRPNGVNLANVLQVISIFELSRTDVPLMSGAGYHSAVAFFSTLHQLLGATVVVQPKFAADDALDLLQRQPVSTTSLPPPPLHPPPAPHPHPPR